MSNGPTHRVYTLIERKDSEGKAESPFWLNIGSAWENKDKKGFNLSLEALPLDGKLVMREVKEPEPAPTHKGSKR